MALWGESPAPPLRPRRRPPARGPGAGRRRRRAPPTRRGPRPPGRASLRRFAGSRRRATGDHDDGLAVGDRLVVDLADGGDGHLAPALVDRLDDDPGVNLVA